MAQSAPFRAAVEAGDLAALKELFTEDARLYSPVKFRPFEGRDMVLGLFGVLLRTFEDFHYVGELAGEARTNTDDGTAPAEVLLFRTVVDGKQVHGMDLLQFDEEGKIKEFTVMVRPQSAAQAVQQAVYAGLVEAGLAPAPAQD
ncbi:nuclear transport factor 2 family protein [Streptomyces sp. TRM66268-LWL]|uniref:Nuclear transport factor 2 family protein n=1 Tax=Streptomyces polyasparticus TaxID=2767826 RepID=A0ABR7SHV6_9ACTN|nr:nuclear transport factor 2 family protein [Streptomyces polyasparticus]MBC9715085.1 nuclear transport factor 2 family protein [Streptomyces polyasparticus]